jgi:hypothetical protein
MIAISDLPRVVIVAVAGVVLVVGLAACGGQPQQPQPTLAPELTPEFGPDLVPALQSPLETPQLPGNVTVVASPITPTVNIPLVPTANRTPLIEVSPALVPTVARTPFFDDGTPDTRATSQAVILTITALAQPPTRRPTSTATTRPIGAGGRGRVTQVPTPTLDPSGISLLSLSQKVYRGGAVTVSIRTRAGANCVLGASNGPTALKVPAPAHQTGSDGGAAWIWPIDQDVPTGVTTLKVDCGAAGSAQYQVEIAQ